MNIEAQVRRVLDEVLSLGGRSTSFQRETRLLGAVPELDSMAVVSLITAIEERFGISIGDDEIDGSAFETFGTLTDFVASRVDAV